MDHVLAIEILRTCETVIYDIYTAIELHLWAPACRKALGQPVTEDADTLPQELEAGPVELEHFRTTLTTKLNKRNTFEHLRLLQ